MIYIVRFEHHYNNNEEWYFEHEMLIKALYPSDIEKYLKTKYPDGYIRILFTSPFSFYEGDMIEIASNQSPVS